jgi:hypothetical protein
MKGVDIIKHDDPTAVITIYSCRFTVSCQSYDCRFAMLG